MIIALRKGVAGDKAYCLSLSVLESAVWHGQDWRAKLGKDPQGRADNKAFAQREQQSLFEKYVKDLALHIEQDFRTAMDQVITS